MTDLANGKWGGLLPSTTPEMHSELSNVLLRVQHAVAHRSDGGQ